MSNHRQIFEERIQLNSKLNGAILTTDQITGIIQTYSGPAPNIKGAERQRYYRLKKKYSVHQTQSSRLLYTTSTSDSLYPIRVLAKEELFEVFQRCHSEGGKHLGRDRLFTELKKHYSGFSREVVGLFVSTCGECQLQRSKKSLKSTVSKPIHSSDFASRGQVDLIDLQNTDEVNRPYNYLLVYQDHLTKFVVLRPLQRKTAEEVSFVLFEIFCLLGPPHILQSDNGKEFRNINLASMIRDLWPECKVVHGKARHPQSQGSVERVNREIKKVLGSLMRKSNDPCWTKYVPIVQHSINTSPHSTLSNKSPYRVLFGREPIQGLQEFGIPDTIAEDVLNEEDLNELIAYDREVGEEDNLTHQESQFDQSTYSSQSSSDTDVTYSTIHSDTSVNNEDASQDTYTREINEENIYPSMSNHLAFNPPCITQCTPVLHSYLETTSTPTIIEEPTNSYSMSHPTFATPFSSYVNNSADPSLPNIPNTEALPHFLLPFNQATSVQTEIEEPRCVQCDQICSCAHHCPGCHKPVHAMCGHSAGEDEGFGSPVWCTECWVDVRDANLLAGRRAAKRGQEKQISRMVKQSSKKFRSFEIGENVLLSIPTADRRSPFDAPNIVGIILNRSDEGFYEIGTSAGRLERQYISTQFDLCHSQVLSAEDIPPRTITLREATFQVSLGRHKQFCNCTGGCSTNRCRCRRGSKMCGSRCHKNLACHNRVSN